jgi:hypothetical protein
VVDGTRMVLSRSYWTHEIWHIGSKPNTSRPSRLRLRNVALMLAVFAPAVFLYSTAFVLAGARFGALAGLVVAIALAWPLARVFAWAWTSGRTFPTSRARAPM